MSETGEVIDDEGLPANARSLISGDTHLRPYGIKDLGLRASQTFREMVAEDEAVAVDYGLIATYGEPADVLALRVFLQARIGTQGVVDTSAAKLCCKYDRLVFGPEFTGDRVALHDALALRPRRARVRVRGS